MILLRQSPIAGTSATKEDLMATRICPGVVGEGVTAGSRVEDGQVLLRCTRVERIHKSTLSRFRYIFHRETSHDTELSITINGKSCSMCILIRPYIATVGNTLNSRISPSIFRHGLPAR